jgi:hemerythrin-like metal-binding protein
MKISWDESLAIGIPEIDNQHRQFVLLLLKLQMAIIDRTVSAHLTDVLDELAQYVKYHFGTEEEHFATYKCYDNAPAHIAAHEAFRERLRQLKFQFLDDPNKLSDELAIAMYDWLRGHIAHMDREYIECFKAHGLGDVVTNE